MNVWIYFNLLLIKLNVYYRFYILYFYYIFFIIKIYFELSFKYIEYIENVLFWIGLFIFIKSFYYLFKM